MIFQTDIGKEPLMNCFDVNLELQLRKCNGRMNAIILNGSTLLHSQNSKAVNIACV